MTSNYRKRIKKQYTVNKLDILIEKDASNITVSNPISYMVRILGDGKEVVTPARNIKTFEEAINFAWNTKSAIEKARKEKYSAECIQIIKEVESYLGVDKTLDRYVENNSIVPCNEQIKGILK